MENNVVNLKDLCVGDSISIKGDGTFEVKGIERHKDLLHIEFGSNYLDEFTLNGKHGKEHFGTKDGDIIEVIKKPPLTAEEWWQFAPWQGMDSAPLYKAIVVLPANHKVFTTSLVAEIERSNYKKWLPLPTNKTWD